MRKASLEAGDVLEYLSPKVSENEAKRGGDRDRVQGTILSNEEQQIQSWGNYLQDLP